jgi:hypothetical protein
MDQTGRSSRFPSATARPYRGVDLIHERRHVGSDRLLNHSLPDGRHDEVVGVASLSCLANLEVQQGISVVAEHLPQHRHQIALAASQPHEAALLSRKESVHLDGVDVNATRLGVLADTQVHAAQGLLN